MKECLWCKTEFEPNKPKQKFCKPKCKTYYHRAIDSSKKTPDPYVILSTGELLIKDEDLKKKALVFLVTEKKPIRAELEDKNNGTPISLPKTIFDSGPVDLGTPPSDEPKQYLDIPINEPKEGSMGFMRKYGVMTYEELKKQER